jgi:hypothetical protein
MSMLPVIAVEEDEDRARVYLVRQLALEMLESGSLDRCNL